MVKKYLFNLYFYFGTLYQILIGILIFILGYFPRLTHIDLLYWPPFLLFTLNNYFLWRFISILIIFLSLCSLISYFILDKYYNPPWFSKFLKIFSIFQIVFLPLGTVCGVYEILILNQREKENQEQQPPDIKSKSITNELGKIQIATGIYRLAIISVLYLLSIYVSAMMLDLVYPVITMSKITRFKIYLLIFGIFTGFQIIFGFFLSFLSNNSIINACAYFIAIVQYPLFPVGTYSSVILIKNLPKYKENKKLKKN